MFNGQPITIVNCGGCSTLGTLAACRWAANMHEIDLGAHDKLSDSTCFEALLMVKANTASYPKSWNPFDIQVLDLRIGDDDWQEVWDSKQKIWSARAAGQIEVKYDQQGEPIKVILDGIKTVARKGSMPFDAIVAICELAAKSADQTVAIKDLYRNPRIVPNKKKHKENMPANLKKIKKYLGETIDITDGQIRIVAKIVLS